MPAKTQTVFNEIAEPQKPNRILAILIVFALLALVVSTIALLITINPQEEVIRNLFVDVNGDGRIDYIKSGIVIFNNESVKNFP